MFEYDIEFVVDTDMPGIRKHWDRTKTSFDCECPWCKKLKLHVNTVANVYRCNHCDTDPKDPESPYHGGMLKLHMLLGGFASTKEANRDLLDILSGDEELRRSIKERAENTEPVQVSTAAEPKVLHRRYCSYLEQLPLSRKHQLDLLKRGLTREDIISGGYRSVPTVGFNTIAENTFRYAYGESIFDDREYFKNFKCCTPGFYFDSEGKANVVNSGRGIYIPICNRKGYTTGMQIRHDDLPETASEEQRKKYKKYCWFSSSMFENGCGVTDIDQIHYTGFRFEKMKTPEVVWLTEGALKANIASALTGLPFIALIGVSNTRQLPKELKYLKEHGTKKIMIAIDMDYREKPSVARALETIKEMILSAGLDGEVKKWSSRYKGIDDILAAYKREGITR